MSTSFREEKLEKEGKLGKESMQHKGKLWELSKC